ncbi:MAG: EamA family transporter, partial [Patescibacteria group bacterium]
LMGVMLGVYSYITNYITNRDKKLLRGYEAVVKILIPVAVLDALAYLGTTWGYSVTQNTTSLITVVANAYSLPTVVLSFLLLRERVSKTQALGIVSIIGGIVISSF